MKRLIQKRRIVCFLSILAFFIALAYPVLAQSVDPLVELKQVANKAGLEGETDISTLIGRIVEIVLRLMGLVLVVMLIIGGFMWMFSGGSEERVKNAKKMIGNAFIGLIIIILAYAAVHFVVEQAVEITK